MEEGSSLLVKISDHVYHLFKENLSDKYTYHNYRHTHETVETCEEISNNYILSTEDRENLMIAAWFHDTGYINTYNGHEKESVQYLKNYSKHLNFSDERIDAISRLIISTSRENPPESLLEEILHDADVIHVGKSHFFSRAELLRVEWEIFLNKYYDDLSWEKLQLDFLLETNFFTEFAVTEYGEQREKNIEEQRQNIKKITEKRIKQSLKAAQEKIPRRGIETLFRSTFRTHINLSSIADSKANMMISINTIIMSVIITIVGSGFTITGRLELDLLRFVLPIGILLLTSLFSVIFAVLSARPSVTSKEVHAKDIKDRNTSVLFFGNFVNMPLNEFLKNMNMLMKNKEMLYDNMSIDLYYLGIVLTKKYKLLRISYNIFMVGLFLAVTAFITLFLITF